MMYHRGVIEEFNIWHELAKQAAGIPPEGKVNLCNGQLVPYNQRTTAYTEAIQNSSGSNDYIWAYGEYPGHDKEKLSIDDVMSAGWFADEV